MEKQGGRDVSLQSMQDFQAFINATCSHGDIFREKLMHVRRIIRKWNWETFGNVCNKVYDLQERVSQLEHQLHCGWSENIHVEWEKVKAELIQAESWDCELLCEKARLDWAKEGDRNSKYFHAVIKDHKK